MPDTERLLSAEVERDALMLLIGHCAHVIGAAAKLMGEDEADLTAEELRGRRAELGTQLGYINSLTSLILSVNVADGAAAQRAMGEMSRQIRCGLVSGKVFRQ